MRDMSCNGRRAEFGTGIELGYQNWEVCGMVLLARLSDLGCI